jgi:hypothetical protein
MKMVEVSLARVSVGPPWGGLTLADLHPEEARAQKGGLILDPIPLWPDEWLLPRADWLSCPPWRTSPVGRTCDPNAEAVAC